MAADDAGNPERPRTLSKGGLAGWQSRVLAQLAETKLAELTVRQMAETAELSLYHFSRAFRVTYGVSPREWLIETRMTQARERLLHSRESIEQIAVGVGYSTSSQFSRAFRSRFGSSPQAFRRRA